MSQVGENNKEKCIFAVYKNKDSMDKNVYLVWSHFADTEIEEFNLFSSYETALEFTKNVGNEQARCYDSLYDSHCPELGYKTTKKLVIYENKKDDGLLGYYVIQGKCGDFTMIYIYEKEIDGDTSSSII